MNDYKALFRSFVYAAKGFVWMVGHERRQGKQGYLSGFS